MTEPNCPDQKQILEYLSGRLDRPKSDRLSAHIDTCAVCNTTISSLNPGPDKLVDGLQNMVSSSFADEPECSGVVQQIASQSPPVARVGGSYLTGAELIAEGEMLRDYRLFEQIGRGGMGAVHRAEHVRLKRPVAIKLLLTDRLQDDSAIARFNREMEAVGKLDHPNIVRATDAGDHDGTHFLVMELVDGPNLSQIARTVGPLRVADACELVRQAAEGLQHAYEHGLVHRDIKPSNLLLAGNGTVKILDLGLALLRESPVEQDELTSSGQIMGTLDYMAPEQASDTHGVDIRADLYSLGCTLYHLLAGAPPFRGSQYSTILKKMMAHAQTPVPPLSNVRSDIPSELWAILDQLLAKEPSDRYATPEQVAAALQPFACESRLSELMDEWRNSAEQDQESSASRSTVAPASSAQSDTLDPDSVQPAKSLAAQSADDADGMVPTIMIEPEPASANSGRSGRQNQRRFRKSLAGFGGILLLGIVFFVGTGEGRVELTVNHRDIQVSVDGEPQQIRVLDGTNGEYRIELPNIPAGRRELIVSRDGFSSETRHFWITRNGDRAFEMKLAPESDTDPAKQLQLARKEVTPNTATKPAVSNLGPAENVLPGLIPRPAAIPGIKRWNLVTRTSRTPVRSIAYSPDNELIAYGTLDGQIRICDRKTGALQNLLISNKDQVKCLQWSHDSRILVAGYRGRVVRLWTRDGELHAEIPTENEVNGVSFSPNGQRFAIAGGAGIQIATLDGEVERVIRHDSVTNRCVCWHPRQDWIATSDFKGILRISNTNGSLIERLESSHPKGCAEMVWSPDGNHLATGLDDNRLEAWDVENWTSTIWTAGRSNVQDIDWHPVDNRILSITADGHVAEWTASGDRIRIFREMTTRVPHCGGYSPDGNEIYIHDRPSVERQTVDGRPLPALHGVEPAIAALSWDRRSDQIVSGERTGTVWRWENTLEIASQLGRLEADVKCIDLNSTDDQMVIAASSLKAGVYSASNLKLMQPRLPTGDLVQAAAWNSSGSLCAFGTEHDGVWLARRGHVSQLAAFPEPVASLAWHHAEDVLAVGGRDGTLLITSPAGSGRQFKLQAGKVTHVKWHPHGDILAGAITASHELRLWNKDGTELRTRPELTYVDQLAWDAAGNALLAAYRDGTVTRINEQLITQKTAKLHSGMVTSLAVHPEKPIAVSGDESGTLIRWDTDTLLPDRVAIVMPDAQPVVFTASGDFVSGDRELFEREFVYVIEDETCRRHLFKPSEFDERRALPGDFSVDDAHPDQRFAQWVLNHGGELRENGHLIRLPLSEDRPLEYVAVTFTGRDFGNEDIREFVEVLPSTVRHLELHIAEASVTSDCFSDLSKLPQLKLLNMAACTVEPEDLQNLKSRSLTQLLIHNVQLSHAGTGKYVWSSLPNLEILLLGENLQSPDFQFNNDSLRDIGTALKRLLRLSLYRTSVTDEGLRGLASLSALRTLQLGHSNLTDAAPSIMATQHPELESLELSNSLITGSTLSQLKSLDRMTVLKLSGCERLRDNEFTQIEELTNLQELHVSATCFGDRHISVIQQLPNLTRLIAKHSELTDEGLKHLGATPSLQLIDIYSCPVTADGVASVMTKHPTLQVQSHFSDEDILEAMGPEGRDRRFAQWVLDRGGKMLSTDTYTPILVAEEAPGRDANFAVDFSAVSDFGDDDLRTMNSLRPARIINLILRNTAVTDAGLAAIEGFPCYLVGLAGTSVTDRSAAVLATLPRLHILDLSGTRMTGASLAQLKSLPELDNLRLEGIPVSDNEFQSLDGCDLRNLVFSNLSTDAERAITDRSMPVVGRMHRMYWLALPDSITDDGIQHLGALTGLKKLKCNGEGVTDRSAGVFASFSELEVLELLDTGVTGETIDALTCEGSLSQLVLNGSVRIAPEAFGRLNRFRELTELYLNNTRITNGQLAALSELPLLKRLNLAVTSIDDAGLVGLTRFPTLEFLVLHRTSVTDAGVDSLSRLKALRTLDVTGTQISEDGLKRLREALPDCVIKAD